MPGPKLKNPRHLDSPLRRLILQPEMLFNDVGTKSNETWADIGCGTGFFAIPLASRVKKVYALDINPQMLERLEQKNKQQLTNIAARLSEENRVPLDDGSVDGVLLALVAHELDRPADYFHEIHRVLTPGGRLVILEFAPGLSFGPPPGHRLSPQQIDRWTQDAGFRKGRSWNYCLRLLSWRFVKLNCLEYIKDQHR